MEILTIEQVKNNGWLIFEAIVGSRAYGLDTEKSDTDIRGVFVLPKNIFYSLDYIAQVSNETNDIVYYELKRFIELLSKNNPNILELLNLPPSCILYKDALMDYINLEMFLSKLCEKTFANYAYSQIKKAYGLEKKIVNPIDAEKKSVLDFCFVYSNNESYPLTAFLEKHNYKQEYIGLTAIDHLRDCYKLFYSTGLLYNGIMRKDNANDVCLSHIPKGEQSIAMLYFNKDGYSVYCKKYKEYWEWVSKRNEERYNTTMFHGKNYDSKNMMHVFRLLAMAKEIAENGEINVIRKEKSFLFDIKRGKYEYDNLLKHAESMKEELNSLYENSILPEEPNMDEINKLLIEMRKVHYLKQKK